MSEKNPYTDLHQASFRSPSPRLRKRELPTEREDEPIEDGMRVFVGKTSEEYAERLNAEQGPEALEAFKKVLAVCEKIGTLGGRALLVGGSVRDEVLGMPSKDFDLEVYGIDPDDIEDIIGEFGRVDAVGKAFGVLKLSTDSGMDIDVSMPRSDSKVSEGHKGFKTTVDPNMSILEAARRRDFTFNALAKDPLTGEIFDPFGGVDDLSHRTLRITDNELFQDDPLRVMRATQFVARFGLRIDPESMAVMRGMLPEMKTLPKERLNVEWEKALLKSLRPSMALSVMHDIGVIDEYYPELADLQRTPQEFEWHPEGDVWTHTMMVVDAAARISERNHVTEEEHRVSMYSALCHDLGKPSTTVLKDGRTRSAGHEQAGGAPTMEFLKRIGVDNRTIDKVARITENHLWPSTMHRLHIKGEPVTDGAFRRLARRIYPATIAELTLASQADHEGRGPFMDKDHAPQLLLPDGYTAGQWVREKARELGVEQSKPEVLIQGRDLIQIGFKPGREFGTVMALTERLRNELEWTREDILDAIMDFDDISDAIKKLQSYLPIV